MPRSSSIRPFHAYGVLAALAVATMAAPSSADTQGFIYGKITTRDETYEGRIRWDDEEAFWGDFFNGTKDELPYLDEVPRRERSTREPLRILGITIGSRWRDWGESRSSMVRFGDLVAIEPKSGDRVTLFLKGGSSLDFDGGSNDIEADIVIWDQGRGRVVLDWDRIDRIAFLPTPIDLTVDVHRLRGIVRTDVGDFRGYVQWDAEECLSTDELDGETRDGDMSIPMGNIRSIARRSRSSSRVTLKDGRELVLDGTNDVDHSNRGILVEDPRYGRVEIGWDSFESVEFADAGASGLGYDDFEPSAPIRGTVKTRNGSHSGRLVYDLDEHETWEMLNGDDRDVEHNIPFGLIAAITPIGDDRAKVTLTGGETLELEDSADVGDGHAGVLVLGQNDRSTYIRWDDIERIDFDS